VHGAPRSRFAEFTRCVTARFTVTVYSLLRGYRLRVTVVRRAVVTPPYLALVPRLAILRLPRRFGPYGWTPYVRGYGCHTRITGCHLQRFTKHTHIGWFCRGYPHTRLLTTLFLHTRLLLQFLRFGLRSLPARLVDTAYLRLRHTHHTGSHPFTVYVAVVTVDSAHYCLCRIRRILPVPLCNHVTWTVIYYLRFYYTFTFVLILPAVVTGRLGSHARFHLPTRRFQF